MLIIGSITGMTIYYKTCENCRLEQDVINNNETTVWDSVFFTLLNGSIFQIKNFIGQKLLVEFASSDCSHCTEQLNALRDLNSLIVWNDKNITILTLLVDLETSKELLTYYIDYNISWIFGKINEENYSLFDLSIVPTFYLFNQTGNEISSWKGEMNLKQLLTFIDIETSHEKTVGFCHKEELALALLAISEKQQELELV